VTDLCKSVLIVFANLQDLLVYVLYMLIIILCHSQYREHDLLDPWSSNMQLLTRLYLPLKIFECVCNAFAEMT
jgi:hypothetical protein